MPQIFNKALYKEYTEILESMGVYITEHLEDVYRVYICEQMKGVPYVDNAMLKMYTVVFFLKYIKQMEGHTRFKDLYSKLEVQKKLIARAMTNVEIDFEPTKEEVVMLENWGSLYSVKRGIGAGLKSIVAKPKKEQS